MILGVVFVILAFSIGFCHFSFSCRDIYLKRAACARESIPKVLYLAPLRGCLASLDTVWLRQTENSASPNFRIQHNPTKVSA